MNTLKYKGFLGSVGFQESEGLFVGKIEGIDSLITFQGESIKKLTASFHKKVDAYLNECKVNGITPKKSYSGTLNIRISPATHNSIADFAAEQGITINSFIKRALEKAVKSPAEVWEDKNFMYRISENVGCAHGVGSVLNEPKAVYGSKSVAEILIPTAELPFAESLADKLGWEILRHSKKTGIEVALDEIKRGEVIEYKSLDDYINDVSKNV